MKEFPQHQFEIVNKFNQSGTLSTFVVRPDAGPKEPLILKLYSGSMARANLKTLEEDLRWQRSLIHPHLFGIIDAGLCGKGSLFTTRCFSNTMLDLSSLNTTNIKQLLNIVYFLHEHGRPHGGIKPSNIFVVNCSIQLADLRLVNCDETSTLESIRFTAPEALLGKTRTIESDYYSLGAVLYRFYRGKDPFDDSIPENLKAKYLHAEIPSIRNVAEVFEPVARAIDGLLQRDPRRRVKAFSDLIRELPFESAPVARVPMISRRDTIEILNSQIASRTTSAITVSLIEGDAGIGKSRLIEELKFKFRFHNLEAYTSTCIHQSEQSLVSIVKLVHAVILRRSKVAQVDLQTLLGSFAETLEPLFEAFLENRYNGFDPPSERTVEDLVGLIGAFSRQEPLTLCIEDIDRAGPAVQDFLRRLCCRASELNVSLILTCRNSSVLRMCGELEGLLGAAFTRIPLTPLTAAESRDLLTFVEPNREKQIQILNRAGGNPLRLMEYARNEDNSALAAGMYELIREKMCGHALRLVQAVSLCRTPISAELLARVIVWNIESVEQDLKWLKSMGAVHEMNQTFEMRIEELRRLIEFNISVSERRLIHKALFNIWNMEVGVPEEILADHAVQGCLWNQAAMHCIGAACKASRRGDYISALDHYKKFKEVAKKLKRKVPMETESEIAICLTRIGKTKQAARIFQRLLTEVDINEDLKIRLLLLSTGGEVDGAYLGQRLKFLLDVLRSSQYGHMHPAILLSKLSGAFVAIGDFKGAADALDRAENLLEKVPDKEGRRMIKGSKAFLLMNEGKFRAALEIFRTLRNKTWSESAAALTNRSVCLEHLGSLRIAQVVQKSAYRLASKAGHLVGQFLCLGNLGVFNTKLGNFSEAHGYFKQLRQLFDNVSSSTNISFKGVEAEEALLELNEGKFYRALQRLRVALDSEGLLKSTRQHCLLLQCEIHFSIGADIETSDIEEIAAVGSWSDSPLYAVQLALLRARTERSTKKALETLNRAIVTAKRACLLYEVCRLELEISGRLQEVGAITAKSHAEEAIRSSRKNGFRPLLARGLLLRGLSANHDKEKEHYLKQSFELASEIGIPESMGESAYHLGLLFHTLRGPLAARGYFANSVRIVSEIAKRIPTRFRSKYLAKLWRKDAQKRHEEYLRDHFIESYRVDTRGLSSENQYFHILYRISIAAASAKTIEEFILDLLPAIGTSHNSVVVMLIAGGRTEWYSSGVDISEELRLRVFSMACKASDQNRFNTDGGWIPFRSSNFSGGLFVLRRKQNPPREDEMDFLTILGLLVSSVLDQIHNRVVFQPSVKSAREVHGIVGNSRLTKDLCVQIETVSKNNATVLIQGETGTGKEVVARAIHKLSNRARAPFIAIDCGAIAEGLIESELFGSKRGSFTGSIADRPGVFEAAHQGSLFLDEISNMNLGMQAKLLRVIQEREIRRVGDTRTRPIDVRLIAASNTNLKHLVAEGKFRQDLLFRLNVIGINIPPLRARQEDIPVLAAYFLNQLNSDHKANKVFGPEVFGPLFSYTFPGNIRELRNAVERSFFTTTSRIISSIPIDSSVDESILDESREWLSDLVEGRKNFWIAIHDRYKRRDISRERVVALIDLGLRTTHGSYKNLASLLHIDPREYRRMMDFLRRNNCLLDFRPYRKVASLS